MKKELVTAFDASLYTGPKSEVVKTWMDLYTEGKLTSSYLREWFSAKIPEFYRVEASGPMLCRFKSSGLLSTLTGYLEEFVYNGEKDRVNEFFQGVGKLSSLCGKGFKQGEPSYNCRECSTDHTCVMCAECFQKSQHRYHKYRMATSTGGGYCDCGDTEAWKSYPSCENHQPSSEAGSAPPFPSDMHKRSELVFSFVLQFSHDVINKFYSADLRVDKMHSDDETQEQQYLLLIYNDEVHTFDQVINLLVQVIRCTPREGLELASKINKEGRAVVTASDFETCSRIKSGIERLSSAGNSRFLEVHILPFRVVAHQCFALNSLLAWTQTLLKTNQGFRLALIEVLEDCTQNTVSLLDKILVQDPVLWKYATTQWNALLCSAFLPENGSKKILASHYLINYPKIMQNYLSDEEDHTFSIAGLSVQLFTVPSISQELIYQYGALESIINFIINVSTNDRNANGKLVFKRVFSRSFERACYLLYDVRYLLCLPPSSTWPDQLRVGFCRGMSTFFDFLGFIEGMDANKRQLGSHIEFEPEWETAFNLQLKCFPVITHSLEWCASDDQALVEVFNTAVIKLKDAQSDQQGEEILISMLGSTFKCIKFDTAENGVTIHLPLTRYWGALYSLLIPKKHLGKAVGQLPILELIDPVMRTRAMIAQFRAGMWRKNGHSLSSQVFFYHDTKFRGKTLDMDIIVLQIGASLTDSNAFLTILAYKFGLLTFFQSGKETAFELPETDTNQLWVLVDEFLYLIIVLIAERFQVGIGNVTSSECIKHELIHMLALKPLSHSELIKAFEPQTEHESLVEAVIKDLTAFKLACDATGKGQYELKDPYHPNFNVFFYRFTKEISFKTEQVKKTVHKKEKGLECCPPPVLPPFLEPFSNIINLLNCDIMLHIMKLVLDHWLKEAQHGIDGQLHKILFLFGTALREEEKSQKTFMFTAKAAQSQIVKMMVDIYCSGRLKDHKDLMKWVLQKYGSLVEDESIVAAMFDYDEKEKNETLESDAKSRSEAVRAKIMADMKKMQEQFSKNFQEFEGERDSVEASSTDSTVDGYPMVCILCQGEELTGMRNKTMVYAAFVQLSTVHMKNREPFTAEDLREILLTTKMGPSPFISTCGHAMHAHCWESWRLDVTRSRATRPSHGRAFSHDPARNEFLCPLCECISNVAMPILPPGILDSIHESEDSEQRTRFGQSEPLKSLTFSQWLDITLKLLCVSDISKKQYTFDSSPYHINSENTPQQDHSSSPAALQQNESPVIRQHNDPLNLTVSEVGYNLNFGDKWILNIKRLIGASSNELEPGYMDIATDKLNWIHAMGSEIFKVATNCQNPLQTVHWDCMMVWKTLAYTIHSLETNLRYSGKRLFVGFTAREEACLENLIKISYVLGVNKKPRCLRLGANQCALKLLDMVIKNDKDSKCMLEWDCFGVLVGLLVVTPNLVAGSSEHVASLERFSLQLMLISRMAQVLMTLDLDKYVTDSPELSSETACLPFLVSLLRHECIIFDADKVWEEVKERVRPFLRCYLIFFHYKQPARSRSLHLTGENRDDDTFESLAECLKLPVSCKELLDEYLTISLFMTWGEHPKVRDFYVDNATSWKFEPYIKEIGTNRINALVKLPQDYSELLNNVRDFSCPDSDIDDSQNPTMCLICGKILCSLSYCCQTELNQQKVGACTFHAHECGGGVGIFLRIRECQLIIFAGFGRGCFKTPPYLDEHHEPDQGLRRGNKLLLCEESYKQLELSWLSHSLYEMVTRSIEMGGFGMGRWLFF